MIINEIVKYLEDRFPLDNAEDFDIPRIGLIIGSSNIIVSNILMSLDLNLEVVMEAIKAKANLIIIHHPYLFEPLSKILFDTEKGEVLELLFAHKISVYAMHTNLDVGSGGVNDVLASKLEIKNIKIANGEIGKHNYLRYGDISTLTLESLAKKVKKTLELTGVRVIGNLDDRVKVIGVIGGSGANKIDIETAVENKCDVLITGEVKLNNAQYAKYLGLNIIEVNHGVEKFVFYGLAMEMKMDLQFSNEIIISDINTDPLIVIS